MNAKLKVKFQRGGTSLVVQWLRLCIPKAGGLGFQSPVRELDLKCQNKSSNATIKGGGSCVLQLRSRAAK